MSEIENPKVEEKKILEMDVDNGKEGRLVNSKYTGTVRNLIIAVLSASFGPIAFGYVIGYSSPAIPDMEKSGLITKEEASWFGSLMTIGGMVGSPFGGWAVDKFGRRMTVILTNIPFIIGWVLIVVPQTTMMLYIGRFLTGFASAVVLVGSPTYIAEISTKNLRGALGSCVQLGITIGILAVYSLGLKMNWIALGQTALLFPILSTVLMFFMPETPRWLLMNGKRVDALRALTFLRGQHVDVEEEIRDMEESLEPQQESMTFGEFEKPELKQPLKVAIGLMIAQQFSGINVVMFYTVSIFEAAGLKESGAINTVIIGAVQVVVSLVAVGLMDRAGRRLLLLVAGTGMCVACLMFSAYFSIPSNTGYGSLALASLVLYVIMFSLGWGPIPMLLTSEIFPAKARGIATSIAVISNWICAFVVTKFYFTLQDVAGQAGAFSFFGICCAIGVIFVYKFVPETKGKSLEDIELYFLGRAIHTRGV